MERTDTQFNKKVIERCPHCNARMVKYTFQLDILDTLLLIAMGEVVRRRLEKDIPFSEANAIHVQDDLPPHRSVATKCRTTQASKLGLVAKVLKLNGKQEPGRWLITKRGWAFLRGEPVPREVTTYRNQIAERTAETITITEAMRIHRDLIERKLAKGRNPKCDYRLELADYRPSDWFKVIPIELYAYQPKQKEVKRPALISVIFETIYKFAITKGQKETAQAPLFN